MQTRHILASASIAALSVAPALADVTPTEVWEEWQDLAARYDATIETQSVDDTGDALTVRGLVLSAGMPEDGTLSLEAGDVVFRDLGDGRVGVEIADRIPMTITSPSDNGVATITMTTTHSGLEMIVSGDATARSYATTADTYGISDVTIDDPSAEDMEFAMEIIASDLAATTTVSGEEVVELISDATAGSLRIDVTGQGTDEMGEPADISFDAEFRGWTQDSTGRFTQIDADGSMAQMLADGLMFNAAFGYDAVAYDVSGEAVDGPFSFVGTGESGSLSLAMDESGLRYESNAGPQNVRITGGETPFPLALSIQEAGDRLSIPLVPSETAQTFELATRYIGIEIDETLWAMFDPEARIPRDPANLAVDITGEVILSEDIFDPAYAEDPAGPPGSIEGVTLNEFRLELAGASLTGEGDFDFIPTELMPQPVGQIDLLLRGGNALIDTLVAMGFVPAEQAMGARMMLGLFAVPGEGEDELTSTIEMREDGGIYANGQRIR